MTLRYRLLGKPGTLNEATDLLVSKGARSVEMNLCNISTDMEAMETAPVCGYNARTAQGSFQFDYIFLGKNNPFQWLAGMIPIVGDVSLMTFDSYQEAYKQLQKQRRDLKRLGIESKFTKD